jgi:hypothetical protein
MEEEGDQIIDIEKITIEGLEREDKKKGISKDHLIEEAIRGITEKEEEGSESRGETFEAVIKRLIKKS